MNTYPECEKAAKVKDESQAIGEFLEWLMGKEKIHLTKHEEENIVYLDENFKENILPTMNEQQLFQYRLNNPTLVEYRGGYYSHHESIEKMLARYFNIDLNVLEQEKRAILDSIRTSR